MKNTQKEKKMYLINNIFVKFQQTSSSVIWIATFNFITVKIIFLLKLKKNSMPKVLIQKSQFLCFIYAHVLFDIFL